MSRMSSVLKTNWGIDEETAGHLQRGSGTGLQAVSEQSPSNISEKTSMSEEDNVHLRVKQCGDGEGLSLAGLEENIETPSLKRSKCFIKMLVKRIFH